MYHWQWKNGKPIAEAGVWPSKWLIDTIGPDYFGRVTWIELSLGANDQLLHDVSQFKYLEYLNIFGSGLVTDAGLKSISNLNNIQILKIGGTQVTGQGLSNLREMQNLRAIDLSYTHLTDTDLNQLTSLPYLTDLSLENTNITNNCLSTLMSLKHLVSINLLGDTETGTTQPVSELSRIPPDPKLLGSPFGGSPFRKKITQASLRKLREALPKLQIQN